MNADWRDTCPSNKDKIIHLYRNDLHTDCAFVVGEGKEKKVFRAHKFVLTLVSVVFETMFYGSVGQDTENIRIPDVDPDVFQIFLNAIYMEEVNPRSFKEASYLLYLANKYMIQGMKDQCLSYMAQNINPSTAAAGFQVLSLFGHTDLASSCWKVIQEETSQVLTSEDFTDLGKETLMRILDEDRLAVESEAELVSAVERWVDADLQRQGLTEETDRLALLSEFLPHIRFISMSVKEFLSFPAREAIFSWADHDSIMNRIGDPESTAILPPNVCSKKRVFLPKKNWKEQLKKAAERGDVGELRRLQAAGADLSVRGDWDKTLLHWAAVRGHAECVQWLLEQGLSLHSTTTGGRTPLHLAAREGSLETVRLLLDSGADPAARDRGGRTPLHVAALYGMLETVWVLLDRGADPAARDRGSRTPLHLAALRGSLETVRVLLDSGADPAARDSTGRTPLDCAFSYIHPDVVDLLSRRT